MVTCTRRYSPLEVRSIACIAGSIAGALRGFSAVPRTLYDELAAANTLDLERRAEAFTVLVLADQP